jgi:hypothetical protein
MAVALPLRSIYWSLHVLERIQISEVGEKSKECVHVQSAAFLKMEFGTYRSTGRRAGLLHLLWKNICLWRMFENGRDISHHEEARQDGREMDVEGVLFRARSASSKVKNGMHFTIDLRKLRLVSAPQLHVIPI